jgi:hypothetical protein
MTPRLAAAAALLAVLTGCGSSDAGPSAEGGGTEPATATTTPAETPAETPTETPTDTAPTVPFPSGEASVESLTVLLPKKAGWKLTQYGTAASSYQRASAPLGRVAVVDVHNVGSQDLDESAAVWLQVLRERGFDVQRLEDREVDGVTGWVVKGTDNLGLAYYDYGTIRDNRFVRFETTYHGKYDPEGAFLTDVVEPVLASVRWK